MYHPKKKRIFRPFDPRGKGLDSEGFAGTIFRLFIKPILRQKPEGIHREDWFDFMFHVEQRTIEEWMALEPFKMPGSLVLSHKLYAAGLGESCVRLGDSLWVRIDAAIPDRIEVEVVNYQCRTNLFILTGEHWRHLRKKIKPVLKTWERDSEMGKPYLIRK